MSISEENKSDQHVHYDARDRIFYDILDQFIETLPDGLAQPNGSIECILCGGTIKYHFARENQHLHYKCSTPNCLWISE